MTLKSEGKNATLSILSEAKEVIRIASDGTIFWNGREIESDAEFKAAMLDLCEQLKRMTK